MCGWASEYVPHDPTYGHMGTEEKGSKIDGPPWGRAKKKLQLQIQNKRHALAGKQGHFESFANVDGERKGV